MFGVFWSTYSDAGLQHSSNSTSTFQSLIEHDRTMYGFHDNCCRYKFVGRPQLQLKQCMLGVAVASSHPSWTCLGSRKNLYEHGISLTTHHLR